MDFPQAKLGSLNDFLRTMPQFHASLLTGIALTIVYQNIVRAIPVIWRIRSTPLLHALRQNRYCLILEAPPINAIEGAFSASIVLIALVVLCDQDLLGRLSFDSVGRALRPKSKSSIQMNGKSCKANPEVTRSARQPSGFWSSASSSSRKSSYMLSKTRIRGIMPPPVRLLPFCKLEDKQSV